jgi:hypothetical protein
LGVVEGRFCRGFCKKRCAERGFLLVKLWWIRGGLRRLSDRFSETKNTPVSPNIFRGVENEDLALDRQPGATVLSINR